MTRLCWISGVVLMLSGAVVTVAQEYRPLDNLSLIADSPQLAAPGEYWLGIQVLLVPQAVRDQLGLPEKQGLLVEAIVPDSPAAKAGIARHDVLLRAGDKTLTEPRELVQVIEATKEAKLKIDLIHGGKPKSVEATPTKRPDEARRQSAIALPGDWETMQKWLEQMSSGEPGGAERLPMRLRIFHPGAIVPNDAFTPAPLPPDMSVVISKKGDHPAKIVVKRGDKTLEVTEKELDKLPADIRPHVERMLGRGMFGVVGGSPSIDVVPKVEPGDQTQPRRGPGMLERMEKRFDDLNRRMDKLIQAMEAMADGPAHKPVPDKPLEK
jgi:hypothetical protein